MEPRKKVRLLVVAAHGCALSHASPDSKHFLSPALLQFAKGSSTGDQKATTSKFDQFYVITNVSSETAQANYLQKQQIYRQAREDIELDTTGLMLHKAVENFTAETKLELAAVATPDDGADPKWAAKRCGSGFLAVIKPLEESEFKKAEAAASVESKVDSTMGRDKLMKNIVAHASHHHVGCAIEIVYVDYKKAYMNEVLKIPKSEIPSNVSFDVYLHDNSRVLDDEVTFYAKFVGEGPVLTKFGTKRPASVSTQGKFGYQPLTDLLDPDRENTPNAEPDSPKKASCCLCQ
jgi:hypothetical protein